MYQLTFIQFFSSKTIVYQKENPNAICTGLLLHGLCQMSLEQMNGITFGLLIENFAGKEHCRMAGILFQKLHVSNT